MEITRTSQVFHFNSKVVNVIINVHLDSSWEKCL